AVRSQSKADQCDGSDIERHSKQLQRSGQGHPITSQRRQPAALRSNHRSHRQEKGRRRHPPHQVQLSVSLEEDHRQKSDQQEINNNYQEGSGVHDLVASSLAIHLKTALRFTLPVWVLGKSSSRTSTRVGRL